MIANAFELKPQQSYQAVTILTVDYALDDGQLVETFRNMAGALAPDGILINYSANVLTAQQALKEWVKAAIGRRCRPGSVLWGWFRSPGAIRSLAVAAGFHLQAQYAAHGAGFAPRSKWLWPFMPLRNHGMIMVFGKKSGAS
jgi:hypothetical protein